MRKYKTTRAVLVHARELVERGWAQGARKKQVGRKTYYCMVGAVDAVSANSANGAHREALHALAEVVFPDSRRYEDSSTLFTLFKFNDLHDQRKTRVLRVFDKAIERL